jgi:hypothetical protein
VSAVTKATAKRRLLKLADFLDKLPPERFDFGTWGDVRDGKSGQDALEEAELCGTTACALGWAPALPFAKKLGIKLQVSETQFGKSFATFTKNGRRISPDRVAKVLFGIGGDAMSYIFHNSVLNGDGTAQEVATGIRAFVAIRFG